jgi:hypothetical protein
MAYLLGCECGKQLSISAGAAGTTVACVCGRRVSVPTLSRLRDLPEVAEPPLSAAAAAERDSWFATVALSVGALVSVVGCAASLIAATLGPVLAGHDWGWVYLPGGVVGFFYNAGLFLVFMRAMRFKEE